MRRPTTPWNALCATRQALRNAYSSKAEARAPIIQINDGTFYRRQPTPTGADGKPASNQPLLPNLTFTLPAEENANQYWAVIGPSNSGKTTFMEVLRGQHLCFPPHARQYPYLSSDEIAAKDHRLRYSRHAIQYVGFGSNTSRGLSGFGSYMSARYESRREATDFSLLDYLKGQTELNPDETAMVFKETELLERVIHDLKLENLVTMPVSNLSNGQSRRARIAKALLGKPEVLLLDEPFMGLDPPTTKFLSQLLYSLAVSSNPRLILALRPQDPVPKWISHVLSLDQNIRVAGQGHKSEILQNTDSVDSSTRPGESGRAATKTTRDKKSVAPKNAVNGTEPASGVSETLGEAVIEMSGVVVKYGEKAVLGGWKQKDVAQAEQADGLHWTVRRGSRWGVFGSNGSGKTTLLSLITSDHPQTYSLPVKLFGRSRLPSRGVPGISLFELQRRVGHSSPEVHAFFPRSLSVRAAVESAYADTPSARPRLDHNADRRVEACLRWFQGELNPAVGMDVEIEDAMFRSSHLRGRPRKEPSDLVVPEQRWQKNEARFEREAQVAETLEWADKMIFGELPFGAQRIALFLRAIVANPDIIILDEAFSGLDERVRDKCLLFLEAGETKIMSNHGLKTNTYGATGDCIQPKKNPKNLTFTKEVCFGGLTAQQAVICVSHVKEEVPSCIRDWIYLPEAGTLEPCRVGSTGVKPISEDPDLWSNIWGIA